MGILKWSALLTLRCSSVVCVQPSPRCRVAGGLHRLFLDGPARFEEPPGMLAFHEQRMPGWMGLVREQPLWGERVLVMED